MIGLNVLTGIAAVLLSVGRKHPVAAPLGCLAALLAVLNIGRNGERF